MYDEAVEMMASERCDSVRVRLSNRRVCACAFSRGYADTVDVVGITDFVLHYMYVLSYVFLHKIARAGPGKRLHPKSIKHRLRANQAPARPKPSFMRRSRSKIEANDHLHLSGSIT